MKNEGENMLDLQPWELMNPRFSWGARYSRPLKTDFQKKKGKGMFCNPAVYRAEEILSIVFESGPMSSRRADQRSTDWDRPALR